MASERPILFSAPMIRALLAGTKTQTRRVVKPQPCEGVHHGFDTLDRLMVPTYEGLQLVRCPYGQAGDRLWVRETFHVDSDGGSPDLGGSTWCDLRYRADGATRTVELGDSVPPAQFGADAPSHWRSSIHMPRWASRITLEVTGVRVERLQDISAEDARAEGVRPLAADHLPGAWTGAFERLWESINGAGAWDANPWVWVIEFRRYMESGHGE